MFFVMIRPYIALKKENPHFVADAVEHLKKVISSNSNISFGGYICNVIFISLLGILFSISMLYAIIAIGSNIKKCRKLIKIILFFAMSWIPMAAIAKSMQQIVSVTDSNGGYYSNVTINFTPFIANVYIVVICFTAIYFAITGSVLKKKINIE